MEFVPFSPRPRASRNTQPLQSPHIKFVMVNLFQFPIFLFFNNLMNVVRKIAEWTRNGVWARAIPFGLRPRRFLHKNTFKDLGHGSGRGCFFSRMIRAMGWLLYMRHIDKHNL